MEPIEYATTLHFLTHFNVDLVGHLASLCDNWVYYHHFTESVTKFDKSHFIIFRSHDLQTHITKKILSLNSSVPTKNVFVRVSLSSLVCYPQAIHWPTHLLLFSLQIGFHGSKFNKNSNDPHERGTSLYNPTAHINRAHCLLSLLFNLNKCINNVKFDLLISKKNCKFMYDKWRRLGKIIFSVSSPSISHFKKISCQKFSGYSLELPSKL